VKTVGRGGAGEGTKDRDLGDIRTGKRGVRKRQGLPGRGLLVWRLGEGGVYLESLVSRFRKGGSGRGTKQGIQGEHCNEFFSCQETASQKEEKGVWEKEKRVQRTTT